MDMMDKGFQLYFNNDTYEYAVDWNDTEDFSNGFWYNADVMQQFVESNFSLSHNDTDTELLFGNSSGNYTNVASSEEMVVMVKMLVMAVVLGLMILITIIGKILCCSVL